MTIDRTKATQRAYDSAAVDFAARTATRSAMAADFFDDFCAVLEPQSVVVEMGCGPGHDLRRLRTVGHRAIGVDLSTALLRLCPNGSDRLAADLRRPPFAPGTVDAVWCSAALLHIDRTDLAPTFAEWDRVVRPGGSIGFATSLGNDEGWELVPATPDRVPEIGPGEQRWFVHHDEKSLLEAVNQIGWRVQSATTRVSHRNWLQVLATTS